MHRYLYLSGKEEKVDGLIFRHFEQKDHVTSRNHWFATKTYMMEYYNRRIRKSLILM